MVDLREKVRQRAPRSISTGVRSNRVVRAVSDSARQHATSATPPATAGGKGECKEKDEVAKLQYALQESEERILLLETLLREKELLQRHDTSLETRLTVYEEQLSHIALSLDQESTNRRKEGPSRENENSSAAAITATTEARGISSAEYVIEGIQRLHSEKKRLQGDLKRKDRLIAALRAELLTFAPDKDSNNQNLSGELPLSTSTEFGMRTGTQTHSGGCEGNSRINALEQRLVQLQGRHVRTEEQLAECQKDCYRAKQLLRVKEKELYAEKRNCRELAVSAPVTPATEEKMIFTQHRQYFKGANWPQLMINKPHALQAAFLKDVSIALSVPHGHIQIVEILPGPSLITIEMKVQHTAGHSFEDIEEKLSAHEHTAMQYLLDHPDDPHDEWDMVDQRLREALETLTARDAEVSTLRSRIRRAESSLDRRDDEREKDTTLVTYVLDETERTLREVYDELDRERDAASAAKESEKKMRSRLEEALAAKDAETALQLGNAENQRNEEVEAARLQVTEQEREILRQAEDERASQVINVAVSHVWNPEAEVDTPLELDNNAADILRTLLLGEVSVACRCAALCVASVDYDAREIRAELQFSAAPSVAQQIVEAAQQCPMASATDFLRELRVSNELLGSRRAEIQRLSDELRDSRSEAEELRKENKRVTAAAEARVQQMEQRNEEAEAKVEKANTLAQEAMAESLKAKDTAKKAVEQIIALKAEKQRAKLEGRIAKSEADKAKAELRSMGAEAEAAKAKAIEASAELQAAVEEGERRRAEALEQVQAARAEAEALKGEVLQVRESALTEREQQRASDRDSLCVVELERASLRTESLRLSASLADARSDLERTADALEAAITAHRQLTAESAVWAESHKRLTMQSRRVADLLAARQGNAGVCKGGTDTTEDLCIAALKEAFAAHDALQLEYDASLREWRVTEETLREEITAQEQTSTELASEVSKLRVAFEESQSFAAAEAEANARLTRELTSHREQANVLVKTLVGEEDTRRALDCEVTVLRAKLAQLESRRLLTIHPEELHRLREFCTRALRLPLSDSHRTVGEIITAMESHWHNALEPLASAAVSVSDALKVLQQCVTASDEHKAHGDGGEEETASEALPKNGRQPPPPVVSVRGLCRSISYSNVMTPVSAKGTRARPLHSQTPTAQTPTRTRSTDRRIVRSVTVSSSITGPPLSPIVPVRPKATTTTTTPIRRTTPTRTTPTRTTPTRTTPTTRITPTRGRAVNVRGTGSETPGANVPLRNGQSAGLDGALSASLASEAAEVLHFAKLLHSRVSHWSVNERCRTTETRELLETRGAAVSSTTRLEKCALGEEELQRRSRADVQRVLHAVTEQLRDTLLALRADRATTDLRMTEESTALAARRIARSFASIFSPAEIKEDAGRRVAECFAHIRTQLPERAPISPRAVPPSEFNAKVVSRGLFPCEVNSVSPLSARKEKQSVSLENKCDTVSAGECRNHMDPHDQELIRQALIEARRRNR